MCAAQANAQTSDFKHNALTLYEWCTSDQKSLPYFYCILYVRGFVDGIVAAATMPEVPNTSICVPGEGLPADVAAAAFVSKWRAVVKQKGGIGPLKETPPEVALTSFLAMAYPCKSHWASTHDRAVKRVCRAASKKRWSGICFCDAVFKGEGYFRCSVLFYYLL
jgi:hypothetical protein